MATTCWSGFVARCLCVIMSSLSISMSPESQNHVSRRRRRHSGSLDCVARHRQSLESMSRDVASDFVGSRRQSRDVARGPNPCRATSPEMSPEHLGDVARGPHPCRATSPETFGRSPATSPRGQIHVARRRQRRRQSTLAMSPQADIHVARRRQRHLGLHHPLL